MFKKKIAKRNCPGDEIIACYVDGILSSSDKLVLEKHMLDCSKCMENIKIQKEVAQLQESQGFGFVPSYVTDRAKKLVAERLRGGVLDLVVDFSDQMFEALRTTGEILLGPKRQPVLSLRDGSVNVSKVLFVKKVFDNIRVEAELVRLENDLINVILTFKDDKVETPIIDLRATLIENDIEIESHITQNGKAAFENMKQGKYRIDISKIDTFVGVIVLELNKK